MTLKERMDSTTADVLRELERLETEIRRIGLERRKALEEARDSDAVIGSTAERKGAQAGRLNEIDGRIVEIEKKLAELRQERKVIAEELARIEEQCFEAHRFRKSANDQARRLEHEIETKVRDKQDLWSRIVRLRCRALIETLGEMERLLGEKVAGWQQRAQARRELERFEKARREDSLVKELWDILSEGEKILQATDVPALVQAVRNQMEAARNKIESMFPGALSARPGVESVEKALEIPCADVRRETRIFLPVSAATWESIKTDVLQPVREGTLRLMWGLAKTLGNVPVRFFRWKEWMSLVVDEVDAVTLDGQEGEIPLSDATSLPFMISRVPRDLEEALSHENP